MGQQWPARCHLQHPDCTCDCRLTFDHTARTSVPSGRTACAGPPGWGSWRPWPALLPQTVSRRQHPPGGWSEQGTTPPTLQPAREEVRARLGGTTGASQCRRVSGQDGWLSELSGCRCGGDGERSTEAVFTASGGTQICVHNARAALAHPPPYVPITFYSQVIQCHTCLKSKGRMHTCVIALDQSSRLCLAG